MNRLICNLANIRITFHYSPLRLWCAALQDSGSGRSAGGLCRTKAFLSVQCELTNNIPGLWLPCAMWLKSIEFALEVPMIALCKELDVRDHG